MSIKSSKQLVHGLARNFIHYVKKYNTTATIQHDQDYEDDELLSTNTYQQDGDHEIQRLSAHNDASTAIEVFVALFPNSHHFQSEESAEEFLRTAGESDDRRIMNQLDRLTERLFDSPNCREGEIIEVADDSDSLRQVLERYTTYNIQRSGYDASIPRDTAEIEPSLWPLVSRIDINFDNRLTRGGLRLADLPGTTDVNHLRKRNTYEFLNTCTHYMIVGKIDRIIKDPNTQSYLSQASKKKPNNAILVATSSDVR